jgi:outer membrane cobalamin receptor
MDSSTVSERTTTSTRPGGGGRGGGTTVYSGIWGLSDKLFEKTQGLQLNQSVLVSDKQTVVWGLDYKWLNADGVTYNTSGTETWRGSPSAEESALYVLSSRKINNKLIMDIGGRYDHHSEFGGQFNPKFGLAYAANDDTTLKLNIARAFRAPNLNDLYGRNGNPNLQPEKAWDYELGVEKRWDARTKGSLTFYREDVDNLIVGRERSGTGRKENRDNMRPQGVELELVRGLNEHVDLFVNYTYLDVGNMTRRASEHKGNFGVNYKNGAFKASLFEQYVGSSYVEDLSAYPNAAELGGFALTNLKFTYEPQQTDYKFNFIVNNLFDKAYEDYLYYPMPGRSYTFSVQKKF